jgi:hypothetical protein
MANFNKNNRSNSNNSNNSNDNNNYYNFKQLKSMKTFTHSRKNTYQSSLKTLLAHKTIRDM